MDPDVENSAAVGVYLAILAATALPSLPQDESPKQAETPKAALVTWIQWSN